MSAPLEVNADLLRSMPLPRHEGDDKEGRGRVLVVGGSREVPGAVLLAGLGALRAGAGKLQVATCRRHAAAMAIALPEARVVGLSETAAGGIDVAAAEDLGARAEACGAVLVGPGMMDPPAVSALAAALIAGTPRPALALDAAALWELRAQAGALRRRGGRVALTPHAGEMAQLLGLERDKVAADPVGVARRAAAELGAAVALKGASSVVAAPDGRVWRYAGGGIGLATSGSGDVLAGATAGLLARGVEPEVALLWAVYLHGEAGRRLARTRGRLGFLARELPAEIPALLAELEAEPG